jgi:hypothetical protein
MPSPATPTLHASPRDDANANVAGRTGRPGRRLQLSKSMRCVGERRDDGFACVAGRNDGRGQGGGR